MAERTTTERVFGVGVPVNLENGKTITIRKWSVRKAAKMGRAISNLVQSFFGILDRLKNEEWIKAQRQAEINGLKEGDPDYPIRAEYEETRVEEIATLVPELLDVATQDLAEVVAASVEEDFVNVDYVLDEFTFEEDFPSVIEAIAALNLSQNTVKKWMGLLTGQTWMKKKKTSR